jgi:hypothetical protein
MERVCLKFRVIFIIFVVVFGTTISRSTSLTSNEVVDFSSNVQEIAREMALEKRLADVRESIENFIFSILSLHTKQVKTCF